MRKIKEILRLKHVCNLSAREIAVIAAWGASNYTYAETTLSQKLPDWIGSHVRAFEYFSNVPRILVTDNLKSGVNPFAGTNGKACFYKPERMPYATDCRTTLTKSNSGAIPCA